MLSFALAMAVVLAQPAAPAPPADEVMSGLDCNAPEGVIGYEREIAFVPVKTPHALQKAYALAEEKLLRKVCQSRDCPTVRTQIKQWKNGRLKDDLCAMVTVPRAVVAEFLRAQRAEIETVTTEKLGERFSEVLTRLFRREMEAGKKLTIAVTIDKIEVDQNNGGPEAEFLKTYMASSLGSIDVFILRDPPNPYDGDGLPKGFDAVLTAKAQTRTEKATEVVDVAWSALIADSRGGARRETAPPVPIPSAVLPRGERSDVGLKLPSPSTSTIVTRLDTRAGGSLCAFDNTNLHITSNTKRTRYVQVFNLFGEGEASLMYAGPLKGHQTLTAGGQQGFRAVPVDIPEEAFIVVASSTPAPVLPIANFDAYASAKNKGPCRLRPEEAKRVWEWDRLPRKLTVVGDGYRVLTDGECPKVQLPSSEALRAMVDGAPFCDDAMAQPVATPTP